MLRERNRMTAEEQLRTYEAAACAFTGGDDARSFVARLNRRVHAP